MRSSSVRPHQPTPTPTVQLVDGRESLSIEPAAGPLVMIDPALVYAFSSGGLLALHAAAGGLDIEKMALLEPPVRGEGEPPDTGFTAEIAELVSSGRRAAAVELFLNSIGVPPEVMSQMAPVRPALEAVAHTLVYDCEISNATTFELLRSVQTLTLVLDRQGSSDDLTGGTQPSPRRCPMAPEAA